MNYSQYKQIEFRRKFFKLFGATIHMTTQDGAQELGIVHMQSLRMRPDITLYADAAQQQPLLVIKSRQAVAMNYDYDVNDAQTGQVLFTLRRKGLKSAFVRDHWLLLDTAENQFGEIIETSSRLALMRRWLGLISEYIGLILAFVPETYTIQTTTGEPQLIANIVHKKNPFIVKMSLDTSVAQTKFDPRLPIASCILLCIRDAYKNG